VEFEHVYEPAAGEWTLLLLHGTGGDEHDLVPLGHQLAPGASILSPRGQVLEGGTSPRFFRRLAVGRLDVPDLLARTDELAEFVRAASERYGFDPERLLAIGLSNGANIAVSLLFRHPGLLRGAALLRPMLPYEPEQPPALTGTDILIAAGEHDEFSSPDQTHRLAEILADAGAQVQTEVATGAGHGLTPGDLEAARRWTAALTA